MTYIRAAEAPPMSIYDSSTDSSNSHLFGPNTDDGGALIYKYELAMIGIQTKEQLFIQDEETDRREQDMFDTIDAEFEGVFIQYIFI